jgi:radical SAM protein with 4Fe4S-binding SPASM domain
MSHFPSGQELDYSAPISVFLNLTQQCNLHCVYCSASAVAPGNGGTTELRDEEVMALVDDLLRLGVFRFLLTGGEPLLRRALLFSILECTKSKGDATVFTNATMLTRDDAQRLSKLPRVPAIILSIDGATDEVNAATRGANVLAKTMRAVDHLLDAGIIPKVNAVVTRHNQNAIPELVAFLSERGLRHVYLGKLQPIGCAEQNPHLFLDVTERQDLFAVVSSLTSAGKRIQIVSGDEWHGYEKALAGIRKRREVAPEKPMLLPCSAAVDQCAITADGWVVPCNSMSSFRCGNVRTQPFAEIWRTSEGLKRVRQLRKTPITVIPECGGCSYNVFCRGGCRALAFNATGSLLGLDPACLYSAGAKEA